jgi:DNA-binding response OmpR family regulator
MKRNNILIVDDDVYTMDIIKEYLKDLKNTRLYSATNTIDAEKLLKSIDFSLIILDIQIDSTNGYELALKIKSGIYKRNDNSPIVFITSVYDTLSDVFKGYSIGSIDYIIKPIKDDIIEKVKRYIKLNRNKKETIINNRMENIMVTIKNKM